LNFDRNLLEFLGTLEIDKIWLVGSVVHLIVTKNKFSAKGDQEFELQLKREFELISR
jgi:hypothetical protein